MSSRTNHSKMEALGRGINEPGYSRSLATVAHSYTAFSVTEPVRRCAPSSQPTSLLCRFHSLQFEGRTGIDNAEEWINITPQRLERKAEHGGLPGEAHFQLACLREGSPLGAEAFEASVGSLLTTHFYRPLDLASGLLRNYSEGCTALPLNHFLS